MYTLYIDETGDWGYPNYYPDRPILCLSGCIVLDDYHSKYLSPKLNSLKRSKLRTEDVVLHRNAVMGRRSKFSVLNSQERLDEFVNHTAEFVSKLETMLLIAALNKPEHYNLYKLSKVDRWLPTEIYSMLFVFIIERYMFFLWENNKASGKVVAESRGPKEDTEIQLCYSTMLKHGTQFCRNWQFKQVLPTIIEFRQKKDNIAGLQISDWIASPFSKKVEYPDGSADKYGEWELYKGKIWLGKKAPAPGQVGFKTFPSNLGRQLLSMALKSL
jgi:hypothetical protein